MYSLFFMLESSRARIVRDDESGQGLAEYGLILALVAVVAITHFPALEPRSSRSWARSRTRSKWSSVAERTSPWRISQWQSGGGRTESGDPRMHRGWWNTP